MQYDSQTQSLQAKIIKIILGVDLEIKEIWFIFVNSFVKHNCGIGIMYQVSNTEIAILRAAEIEFIEKGFSGARTVSIAQAAGVTHAMFHYYFRTKEQLFERVLTSKLTLMIDSVFESLEKALGEDEVMERIEAFVRCHYMFLADNNGLPRFIINEVVHNPERIELLKNLLSDKINAIDKSFGSRFAKAIAEGEIVQCDILTIITDILMLNLASIVMRPLFQNIMHRSLEEYDDYRIKENITLVKRRLQP